MPDSTLSKLETPTYTYGPADERAANPIKTLEIPTSTRDCFPSGHPRDMMLIGADNTGAVEIVNYDDLRELFELPELACIFPNEKNVETVTIELYTYYGFYQLSKEEREYVYNIRGSRVTDTGYGPVHELVLFSDSKVPEERSRHYVEVSSKLAKYYKHGLATFFAIGIKYG